MNKSALRSMLRQRRSAMTAGEVAAASAAIQKRLLALDELAAVRAVFIYVSHRNEVATHRLIDALVGQGKQVLIPWIGVPLAAGQPVPVCGGEAGEAMHAVPFPGWNALKPDRRGFLAPTVVQDRGSFPTLPREESPGIAPPSLSGRGRGRVNLVAPTKPQSRPSPSLSPEGRGVEGQPPRAESLDLCIAPGVGFAPNGARLGQGGGHYDRFLAAHPGLIAIGLCYEWQVLDALPSDPTDRPVDVIVTEQRVLRRGK